MAQNLNTTEQTHRNTYTREDQARNDALRAQYMRQAAYASRFFGTGARA